MKLYIKPSPFLLPCLCCRRQQCVPLPGNKRSPMPLRAVRWRQTAPLSSALKSVCLWSFNEGIGKTRRKINFDRHQKLKHKSELIIKQLSHGLEHVMTAWVEEMVLNSQKDNNNNNKKQLKKIMYFSHVLIALSLP